MNVSIIESNAPSYINELAVELSKLQCIFWSDDRKEHWFFDFKIEDYWVSAKSISNDLKSFEITIFK